MKNKTTMNREAKIAALLKIANGELPPNFFTPKEYVYKISYPGSRTIQGLYENGTLISNHFDTSLIACDPKDIVFNLEIVDDE